MSSLVVDFLMDETVPDATEAPEAVRAQPALVVSGMPKCFCGSENYVLANEMIADTIKGIPASRMYECIGCGKYRLG